MGRKWMILGAAIVMFSLVLYGCAKEEPAAAPSEETPHEPATHEQVDEPAVEPVPAPVEKPAAAELQPLVPNQTICPVTGEPIRKAFHADYKGKRVYFCCANCIAEFQKDPEKYVKKLTAEQAPAETGAHEKHEEEGHIAFWTCSMHPQIRLSKPGKCQICAMDLIPAESKEGQAPAEAEKPEATLLFPGQKFCPVMAGPINKNLSIEHEGKRVYFCCAGCPEQFKKDPAKYIAKITDAEKK